MCHLHFVFVLFTGFPSYFRVSMYCIFHLCQQFGFAPLSKSHVTQVMGVWNRASHVKKNEIGGNFYLYCVFRRMGLDRFDCFRAAAVCLAYVRFCTLYPHNSTVCWDLQSLECKDGRGFFLLCRHLLFFFPFLSPPL